MFIIQNTSDRYLNYNQVLKSEFSERVQKYPSMPVSPVPTVMEAKETGVVLIVITRLSVLNIVNRLKLSPNKLKRVSIF